MLCFADKPHLSLPSEFCSVSFITMDPSQVESVLLKACQSLRSLLALLFKYSLLMFLTVLLLLFSLCCVHMHCVDTCLFFSDNSDNSDNSIICQGPTM
jgi:hypothetical protein